MGQKRKPTRTRISYERYGQLVKIVKMLYGLSTNQTRVSAPKVQKVLKQISDINRSKCKFKAYVTCIKPDLKWHGRVRYGAWDRGSKRVLEQHFQRRKTAKNGYKSMGYFLRHFFDSNDAEDVMLVPDFKSNRYVSDDLKVRAFQVESAIVALFRHGKSGLALIFVGSPINLVGEMALLEDFRGTVVESTRVAPIVLTKWFLRKAYHWLNAEHRYLRKRFSVLRSDEHTTGVLDVHEHSLRVARISLILVTTQGLTPLDRLRIFACGIMHDVGKEMLGDKVLKRLAAQGKWKVLRGNNKIVYKLHPQYSAQRFLDVFTEWPEWAIPIICHHDKSAVAEGKGVEALSWKIRQLGFNSKRNLYRQLHKKVEYKQVALAVEILQVADSIDGEDLERLQRHEPRDVDANLDRFKQTHRYSKILRDTLEEKVVREAITDVLINRTFSFPHGPGQLRKVLINPVC